MAEKIHITESNSRSVKILAVTIYNLDVVLRFCYNMAFMLSCSAFTLLFCPTQAYEGEGKAGSFLGIKTFISSFLIYFGCIFILGVEDFIDDYYFPKLDSFHPAQMMLIVGGAVQPWIRAFIIIAVTLNPG